MPSSPHFLPPFVAICTWMCRSRAMQRSGVPEQLPRRRKAVSCMSFATEEYAGIVDTMFSALIELKTCRVQHSVVAVEARGEE